ncbi:MAG TPA: class I SAM-dependent methyltransferase [Solirubrobacteraceae bacterium]|nr:class I SAM-dependent methyltransferase [Solirubrobacteraceae bacterium]
MNLAHNLLCSSDWWATNVKENLLPWGLEGLDLGDDVLEVGPGFGATTRILAERLPKLTALELSERYCKRLRAAVGDKVEVVHGDATALPFDDDRFSAVVCFTMLHHIPSPELQDQALHEIARVLVPGGLFAGTDSVGKGRLFKLIHIGDILQLVDPGTFGGRLVAAGFSAPQVVAGRSMRWRTRKPAVAPASDVA